MKINQKNNQHGFSHLVLLIGISAVIVVTALSGYAVVKANKKDANKTLQTNSSVAKITNAKSESKTKNQETQNTTAATSSTVDSTQAPAAGSTTTKPASSSTPAATSSSQPQAPSRRAIQFVKGGAGQNGNDVDITMYLSENQAGKCTYKFSIGGTVVFDQYNYVVFDRQCLINIATSDFPQSGTYDLVLSFMSNDGLVTAEAAYPGIVVTK